MALWTVFEPGEEDGQNTTLRWAEGVVFVPERLSWSALPLAPLVLLRHRLWLAFIVYGLVQGAVTTAGVSLGLDGRAVVALLLVANVAVAVFLPGLRRAKLAAKGYEEAGCVVAPKLEAAEQRYFDARLGHVALSAPASQPGGPRLAAAPRAPESAVLGLFPEVAR